MFTNGTKYIKSTEHVLFDRVFIVSFVAVTLIGVWLSPLLLPYKLAVILIVLFMSIKTLPSIFLSQKAMTLWTWKTSIGYFIVGVVIILLSIWIVPVWKQAFILLLDGHYNKALEYLQNKPHSNPILFGGLWSCYCAFAVMIRLFLLKILRLKQRIKGVRAL
ncbi:MAG: hypothetical protein ACREGC_01535 [Minisyncoccia bacterium]